jgi:hypothetical protein
MEVFKPENLDTVVEHWATIVEETDNYVELGIGFFDIHTVETLLEYGLAYAGEGENGYIFRKI